MRNEGTQPRLQQLRSAELEGSLTEAECAELAVLVEERCQYENAAIQEAARSLEEDNARLAAQAQQVAVQNQALEELLQEQEAYLAEAEALLTQMETRRRQWRERYVEVTGEPFAEPATVGTPAGAV